MKLTQSDDRDIDWQMAASGVFRYPESSIVSLPELPPEPEPLDEWYASEEVEKRLEAFVKGHLRQTWQDRRTTSTD